MPSYAHSDAMSSTVFLRRLTIFTFFPASILLVIHGILSSFAFPALGTIPQAGSAVLGALLLYRNQVALQGSPIRALSSTNIFFADSVLTVTFLAMIIPTFVLLAKPEHEEMIVLGTYGSVFMIINLYVNESFSHASKLFIVSPRVNEVHKLTVAYLASSMCTSPSRKLSISSQPEPGPSSLWPQTTCPSPATIKMKLEQPKMKSLLLPSTLDMNQAGLSVHLYGFTRTHIK